MPRRSWHVPTRARTAASVQLRNISAKPHEREGRRPVHALLQRLFQHPVLQLLARPGRLQRNARLPADRKENHPQIGKTLPETKTALRRRQSQEIRTSKTRTERRRVSPQPSTRKVRTETRILLQTSNKHMTAPGPTIRTLGTRETSRRLGVARDKTMAAVGCRGAARRAGLGCVAPPHGPVSVHPLPFLQSLQPGAPGS